jgi:Nucleotide-diphospho-sugar transferase
MLTTAERQRSSRQSHKESPWLLVFSHLIVGIVCFHYGFSAGATATTKLTGGGDRQSPVTGRALGSDTGMSNKKSESFPPESLKSLFVGSAVVPRDEFTQLYDLGVPWDEPAPGAKDVLLLYGSERSLPDHASSGSVVDATHNCDTLKVILTKNTNNATQCLAIVPQWESYHVHKFMRLKPDGDKSDKPAYAATYPLRIVSRRHEIKGTYSQFPSSAQRTRFYSLLVDYLQKLDDTLARLKPLAQKAAGSGKAVVVQVVNFGQAELLFNFVCNAKARKLDVSNILVFATDNDTYELVKGIGLHVFEVGDAFGDMPTGAAKKYGDRTFQVMMLSKVYCVHLINAMGYDVLFQDVDVIWYQNPIEYFQLPVSGNFDISFQDGALFFVATDLFLYGLGVMLTLSASSLVLRRCTLVAIRTVFAEQWILLCSQQRPNEVLLRDFYSNGRSDHWYVIKIPG